MLNRTNRTLSANPTRLNLGTRSFALVANGNIGNETLRNAHAAQPVAVRAGRVRYLVPVVFGHPLIKGTKSAEPAMVKPSGSSPMPSWPDSGRQAWDQAPFVADPLAVVRPVADTVANPSRWGVAPQASSPARRHAAGAALAACLRPGSCLAGRSARDAVVSDAAS